MSSTTTTTTVEIIREINAPVERLYAAWTDLELARKWWGPENTLTHELMIDPRVDGKFRWSLSSPDGEKMTALGVYSEVSAGEKIAFTWHWADDPEWETRESLVTVEFHPEGTAITELHLTHENLPNEKSRDNHTAGWNSALDKLERVLTAEVSEPQPAQ